MEHDDHARRGFGRTAGGEFLVGRVMLIAAMERCSTVAWSFERGTLARSAVGGMDVSLVAGKSEPSTQSSQKAVDPQIKCDCSRAPADSVG